MDFVDRLEEMRRLDNALRRPGGFAVIWGRRRVGKSRLLIEWSKRNEGLYTVADQSAPAVQRRYLAAAVAKRFPGFADVEYPDWRAFFTRLAAEAARTKWQGPFILDELPYLIAADPTLESVLQNWLDGPGHRPCVVVSGSVLRMMRSAVLDADAPLYGRAAESFAVCPLRPGYLGDVFSVSAPRELVSLYALWGGMPRYWELAEPFGTDFDSAVDSLVLDPSGPLHNEPDRLLLEETPSALALRPLLDVIGSGAHRVSEIGARLGRPASSLPRPLSTLAEMNLVIREVPFGSDTRSGKRSLYRIADPFFRLWFRVVAPHRAALAEAPRETRLGYWHRYRAGLESAAWEELCRMAVPFVHLNGGPLGDLGPWEPAKRYWHGNDPEFDVVARSVDGVRTLVGEAKWGKRADYPQRGRTDIPPGAAGSKVVRALFIPDADTVSGTAENTHIVDAGAVMTALRGDT